MKVHLALLLLMGVSCFATKARYDNYKLYGMTITNEEQIKAVDELGSNSDSYDFWSDLSLVRDVDVMVPPHKLPEFEDFLTRFKIQYQIKVENIQEYDIRENLVKNCKNIYFFLDSLMHKIQN